VTGSRSFDVVRCILSEDAADELGGWLAGVNVLGCELRDLPGRNVEVLIYVEGGGLSNADEVGSVARSMGALEVRVEAVHDCDWLEVYRREAAPFSVGETWWIDPRPGSPTSPPTGRKALRIEPRAAFGTGTHESTRLLLIALEQSELAGGSVLDVGTGSGILAIAASLQGAQKVVALDLDPAAVFVARRTLADQPRPVGARLVVGTPQAVAGAGFDVVLCNLIWGRMSPLLPALAGLVSWSGWLLLSGLLVAQRAAVLQELARNGLRVARERALGEWLALETARVSPAAAVRR